MSRFVDQSDTVDIVLANGDHVTIRAKLTAVEDARLNSNLIKMQFNSVTKQPEIIEGNWFLRKVDIAKAYLTAWDFKDNSGQVAPYRSALIETLDQATVDEIASAIDSYLVERAVVQEKKEPAT